MNPIQLKAALDKLPEQKTILCQMVDRSGHAFNAHFDLIDVQDSWMIQLRVSHPELVDLYDILTIDEEEAKPFYHVQAVAMIVKRVVLIAGGGITVQHGLASELFPATAIMVRERSSVMLSMGPAGNITVTRNGVVMPHESERSLPKYIANLLRV